jgi:hypothetical protein
MFLKDRIRRIFKSILFASLWVAIITCTTFPDILERGNHFFTEQYDFEHVGQVLLIALGIYTFDLMMHILYSIDEYLHKIFIVQILGGVSICVFTISLTKNMGVYNICPLMFVGISMCYMKAITLSMNSRMVEQRKLQRRTGDL